MITRARRRELASQDGFALMEVIIAAAILILVVLGVLAGLDSVTSTAGANKARTVAATLAEKDQERLRGMKTLDIDKMNLEPYDVLVGKVTYHVESEASWVYDASGDEVSCGVTKGQASYMRISSTVTSPITGKAVKPVVISSIVAPQVGATAAGSLSVVVKGAAGQPIKGVTVTAPPAANVETTNDLGCAVFGQLTAGTYTVGLSKGGYVDKEGVANPTLPAATVTAGNMSTVEMAYDIGASITVNVKNTPSANADEPSATVLGANGELGAGLRTFALTGPVSGPNPAYPTDSAQGTYSGKSFLLTGLFPFTSGYAFYSGRCIGNDPSKKLPGYFDTNPGRVVLAPGEAGGNVTVYEPPTNLRFRFGGSNVTNANVYAYPIGTGCGGNRIPMGVTTSNGHVTYQGLPYGDYQICGEYKSSGIWYEGVLTSYTVKDQDGNPTQTTVNIADSNKTCGTTAP
jgi:Tfp pilus assembly protein PilV